MKRHGRTIGLILLFAWAGLVRALPVSGRAVDDQARSVAGAEVVRCTGKVVDAGGLPVEGAGVAMCEMLSDGLAGNFVIEKTGELTTRDDGAFAFTVPPRPATGTRFIWSYVVASKEGLALGWAIWDVREDLTVTIVLDEPGTAEGVIVDEAGRPVVDAHVCANLVRTRRTAEGEEKKEWLSGRALPSRLETRTDSQGRFVFGGLPKDAAVVYLVAATGKATIYTQEPEQGEQPPVRPGQAGVRFVLPREGRIAGRILDPDTSQGLAKARFAVVPTFSGLMYYRLVCTTDEKGTFAVGGLKSGKYLIRGDGLPHTYVEVRSGATTDATIRANTEWYGRILFHDGEPAVVKPAPWPGAATMVFLAEDDRTMGERIGPLDDEGYFRVYLSQEQYEKLRSAKAWFQVHLPEGYDPVTRSRRMRQETVLAVDLLARDKTRAGVARIVRPPREPISLLDKALPSLDPLGLTDMKKRAEGKTALLCFVDVQQRPSRNCLHRLTEKAEELKAEDFVILAIQVSGMDRAELDKWIMENNVSFPVSMSQGDPERLRLAWGVQSLPWLILAEDKHIVRAEGFSVDELEERMEQMRSE